MAEKGPTLSLGKAPHSSTASTEREKFIRLLAKLLARHWWKKQQERETKDTVEHLPDPEPASNGGNRKGVSL